MKKSVGFTIVELLIVIVVIAILAAITIVAYNGFQQRAKVSRANSDLNSLSKAIQVARVSQNKTLLQITGQGCTCGNATLTPSSISAIANASGTNLDSLKNGDPWGNRYYIDENEGETAGNPCIADNIRTDPFQSGTNIISIPTYSC